MMERKRDTNSSIFSGSFSADKSRQTFRTGSGSYTNIPRERHDEEQDCVFPLLTQSSRSCTLTDLTPYPGKASIAHPAATVASLPKDRRHARCAQGFFLSALLCRQRIIPKYQSNKLVPGGWLWHVNCVFSECVGRRTVEHWKERTNMSAQAWLNADLVRLQKAVLCANCEVISEGLNGHCAACGSEALLCLKRLLGSAVEVEF